jgi:hypothetical protein
LNRWPQASSSAAGSSEPNQSGQAPTTCRAIPYLFQARGPATLLKSFMIARDGFGEGNRQTAGILDQAQRGEDAHTLPDRGEKVGRHQMAVSMIIPALQGCSACRARRRSCQRVASS